MWINLSDEEVESIRQANLVSMKATGGLVGCGLMLKRIAESQVENNSDLHRKYREAISSIDGKMEIDDDAIVSIGADDGAYIMAWVWVTNEDAGIESEDEEDKVDGV